MEEIVEEGIGKKKNELDEKTWTNTRLDALFREVKRLEKVISELQEKELQHYEAIRFLLNNSKEFQDEIQKIKKAQTSEIWEEKD